MSRHRDTLRGTPQAVRPGDRDRHESRPVGTDARPVFLPRSTNLGPRRRPLWRRNERVTKSIRFHVVDGAGSSRPAGFRASTARRAMHGGGHRRYRRPPLGRRPLASIPGDAAVAQLI